MRRVDSGFMRRHQKIDSSLGSINNFTQDVSINFYGRCRWGALPRQIAGPQVKKNFKKKNKPSTLARHYEHKNLPKTGESRTRYQIASA